MVYSSDVKKAKRLLDELDRARALVTLHDSFEAAKVPVRVRNRVMSQAVKFAKGGYRGKELYSKLFDWINQFIDERWVDILIRLLPIIIQVAVLLI